MIHLLSFLWEESNQVLDSCKTNQSHFLQWVYMLQAVWSLQGYLLSLRTCYCLHILSKTARPQFFSEVSLQVAAILYCNYIVFCRRKHLIKMAQVITPAEDTTSIYIPCTNVVHEFFYCFIYNKHI